MMGWAVALRVARREARRTKGRSALVVAMIMLPVMALSFVAVTYDMFRLTPTEELETRIGRFDAEVRWRTKGPLQQDVTGEFASFRSASIEQEATQPTTDDLLRLLPPGSRAVPRGANGFIKVRTAAGAGEIETRRLDLTDAAYAGMVVLLRGRAPANDTEVALTEPAAKRIGVTIGGTVRLFDGSKQYAVVGLVEFPAALREVVVLRPDSSPTTTWLVDTPEPLGWPAVQKLNASGIAAYSRTLVLDPPPGGELLRFESGGDVEEFSAGALVLGLGILEIILLAGPAFAVGARRRRRDLALVAANGGTPAHLRRIVLADGIVLGIVGAVAGVLVGVAAAFVARPWFEELVVHQRAGGYRVFPLALAGITAIAVLTGLLAALVPAFIAARQDVIAALAGRRGVIRSRKRWVVLGLIMVGGGAALAAVGAWKVSAGLVTFGLIVAELGLVLCTPALIGLIARTGRVLPLASRIALRDTARNRAAAAPAISAVMAAVVGSITLGIVLGGESARTNAMYIPNLPLGYAALTQDSMGPDQRPEPLGPAVLDGAARKALPVSNSAPVSRIVCPSSANGGLNCMIFPEIPKDRLCPYEFGERPSAELREKLLRDERCVSQGSRITVTGNLSTVVDDGTALPQLTGLQGAELARAAQTLRDGGVVAANPLLVNDGKVTLIGTTFRDTGQPEEQRVTVPGYALPGSRSVDLLIIGPGAVKKLGYEVVPLGIVIATSRMPTDAEVDAFRAAGDALNAGYWGSVERPLNQNEDLTLLILAIAAGVIALGAAAIATGLAAVDGRADLATLAAVGASPGLRRRLSLNQSGVIAGLGSVLGALAGLGAGVAVLAAYNRDLSQHWPPEVLYPITMPWSSLLIAVLVVPVVAMLGAGLLTRSRLPIERRL
jgi:putative ABC transport system permease protein